MNDVTPQSSDGAPASGPVAGPEGTTCPAALVELGIADLVLLGAQSSGLFAHGFFSKTFRQEDAPFSDEQWEVLDNPAYQFVNMQSFRDSGKTTKLRTYMAKRVAYGISKTILYLGATEDKANRSIQWLRNAVENNKLFSQTFGLRKGVKWQEHEAQIFRETENETAWIIGLGITSQDIRGLNFDDYRPDLIVLDDCITDENAASAEQRKKLNELIYGAVIPGLAPRTEAPLAKVVMLQTPLNAEDASSLAERDPMWKTFKYSCWTPETQDEEIEQQVSSWPARHTSEDLRGKKRSAIAQHRYSVFAREYECRIISAEKAAFPADWLQYFHGPAPRGPTYVFIDPVPPPSEAQIAKNMLGKDYECVGAIRRAGGSYYVLDYRTNRGHEPNWTVAVAFEMAEQYGATGIVAEAQAYQRALLYILRSEMQRKHRYWACIPFETKNKSKYLRITSALSGPMQNKKVLCREHHYELISQVTSYPGVSNDDIIDMLAMGVQFMSRPAQESPETGTIDLGDEDYEELSSALLERSP